MEIDAAVSTCVSSCATQWLLEADIKTVHALLWAVGEFAIRCMAPDDTNKLAECFANSRCLGGVKQMYEIAQRRRAEASHAPEVGIFRWGDDKHVPTRLAATTSANGSSITAKVLRSVDDLGALCQNAELTSLVRRGKYTDFWHGDVDELI